jgi:hypothetical protein
MSRPGPSSATTEAAPEGELCLTIVASRPDGDELVRLALDADAAYALAGMLDSYMHPAGWRWVSASSHNV